MTAIGSKLRRDNARAAGLCQTCTKAPTDEGRSTCERCTLLKRKWNAEYAAKAMRDRPRRAPPAADRFCVDCQAHGRHRSGCSAQP